MITTNDGFINHGTELGVKAIHLVSGEDLIGKVFRSFIEGKSFYEIEQPWLPHTQLTPQGTMSVMLLPYRPYLKENAKLVIPDNMVMFVADINERMEKLYLQSTSNLTVTSQMPNARNLDELLKK